MAMQDPNSANYYEIITMNAQKGETYAIKFKNDPTVYVGIPVLYHGFTSGDEEDVFSLKVLEPKERQGILRKSIRDIELLEVP
jgi:hypothetical protein